MSGYLKSRALILWLTGLSGSGKSTLANKLREVLEVAGETVVPVDGDAFRRERSRSNVFTREGIIGNNYEIIDHCRKLSETTDVILVSVISPFRETRDVARRAFGGRYCEIFVTCGMETLVRRDTKGLYAAALSGKKKNLIGLSEELPYEPPLNPELTLKTDEISVEAAVEIIKKFLQRRLEQEAIGVGRN